MTRRYSREKAVSRRALLAHTAAGVGLVAMSGINAEGGEVNDRTAADLRAKLLQCLGGPWPEPCDLRPMVRETIRKDGYRHRVGDLRGRAGRPRAGVCCWCPTASMPAIRRRPWPSGTSTTASGTWARSSRPGWRAVPCTTPAWPWPRRDTSCSAPMPCASGSGRASDLQGGDFERFEFLRYVVAGKCMAWKNILDMRRAVDYLCSRPEVQGRPHRLLRPLDGLDPHVAGRALGSRG